MSELVDLCKKRMGHLRSLMEKNEIDVVYFARGSRSGPLYKKLANTTTGQALLIPLDGNPVLFCGALDYESTKDEAWIQVRKIENREKTNEEIAQFINDHLKGEKSKISVNISDLSSEAQNYLKERLKGDLIDLPKTLMPELLFGLYPEEIRFQRKVSELADIAVSAAREAMAPGVHEYEIAAEANYAMMKRGAEMQSFATLIASGERSAYCHGAPTDRELKKGDLMIVDLGPSKYGYAADETRTFLLGRDEKKEKMLIAVDKAVEAVLNNIKAGVSCKELDAISRQVLKEHGFPDYPHSLGHSISGFVVPALSKNSEHILKEGMVFTVEPGIYFSGYGGVRLEENVVITDYGYEQLTKSPRLI